MLLWVSHTSGEFDSALGISCDPEAAHGSCIFAEGPFYMLGSGSSDSSGTRSIPPLAVLWIDDETTVLNYVASALPREGFDITGVTTGAGGLALARTGHFDLVVLDLRMPDMSGLEVLRQLRADRCWVPVVIFTAYPSDESAHEAGYLYAVRYLKKPLAGEALVVALREAVNALTMPPWALPSCSQPTAAPEVLSTVLHLLQRMEAETSAVPVASQWSTWGLIGLFVDASDTAAVVLPQFAALARVVKLALGSLDPPDHVARLGLQLIREAIALESMRMDPIVSRAIERFAQPLSLQEEALADLFDLHPSTIGRALKSAFGFGYRELRWAALIRPSIGSLARSLAPIKQVAIECGYVTHDRFPQFDRDFERVLGVTPRQFRRLATRVPSSRKN